MENYKRKEVGVNGSVYYYNSNGNYHRLDGPAIEYATGGGYWFFDGKLHRADGPAVERWDGSIYWCFKGKYHRIYGPAILVADGRREWCIRGIYYTKSEHNKLVLFSILESQRFNLSPTED
jgi:hypothetical protein